MPNILLLNRIISKPTILVCSSLLLLLLFCFFILYFVFFIYNYEWPKKGAMRSAIVDLVFATTMVSKVL